MKAIVQDVYGPAEVLHLRDVDRPTSAADEVLVRVHAAGVDPGVWHLMTGLPYPVRLVSGLRAPRNGIPGMDVAGRVEAVGADVTAFRPGDAVYGTCVGAFAEYACAKAGKLAPKPANLSFEQAAAVPVSACTALQGLRDQGRIQAGQRVLVTGASGGVGAYAVQLATAYGAVVTGVCGPTKADLVRSIGAADVIDYTAEDCTDGTRQWDLILDTAGNRPLSHLRRALTPKGTLVIVGGEVGGRWLQGADRQLRAILAGPWVSQTMRGLMAVPNAADLEVLRALIEAGEVTPVIDRTYPLAEAADAIRYLKEGHPRGKIVLTV